MKALIQRVKKGAVTVDNETVGKIDQGFVVMLGVKTGDTEEDADYLAQKTLDLRIFADKDDKMNLSVQDIKGEILVISQFTLYADTKKGNRPSFAKAAPPDTANALYGKYVEFLRDSLGKDQISTGTFQAMMTVEIINDGPVTVELTSDHK